ncbi:MAG: hypothetical protein ACLS8R_08505 [Anaeromassilibacillus sp.]
MGIIVGILAIYTPRLVDWQILNSAIHANRRIRPARPLSRWMLRAVIVDAAGTLAANKTGYAIQLSART